MTSNDDDAKRREQLEWSFAQEADAEDARSARGMFSGTTRFLALVFVIGLIGLCLDGAAVQIKELYEVVATFLPAK